MRQNTGVYSEIEPILCTFSMMQNQTVTHRTKTINFSKCGQPKSVRLVLVIASFRH